MSLWEDSCSKDSSSTWVERVWFWTDCNHFSRNGLRKTRGLLFLNLWSLLRLRPCDDDGATWSLWFVSHSVVVVVCLTGISIWRINLSWALYLCKHYTPRFTNRRLNHAEKKRWISHFPTSLTQTPKFTLRLNNSRKTLCVCMRRFNWLCRLSRVDMSWKRVQVISQVNRFFYIALLWHVLQISTAAHRQLGIFSSNLGSCVWKQQ